MSSNSPISRFENFARELVEGSFDRLMGQPGSLNNVAKALAAAARDSESNGLIANHYVVRLDPLTQSELVGQTSDPAPLLEEVLRQLAERERLVFPGQLRVELITDPKLPVGQSKIAATSDDDESTAILHRRKGGTSPLKMTEAYLIIGGRRHVALEQTVNKIGRSLDNDIVLEDPGVSRAHAQIRWRNGRFVIFDLGSRAGTRVNGRRATETILSSGDVIMLGSAALIYGEDEPAPAATGEGAARADGTLRNDYTQELPVDEL